MEYRVAILFAVLNGRLLKIMSNEILSIHRFHKYLTDLLEPSQQLFLHMILASLITTTFGGVSRKRKSNGLISNESIKSNITGWVTSCLCSLLLVKPVIKS
jgi:hypothetical protein